MRPILILAAVLAGLAGSAAASPEARRDLLFMLEWGPVPLAEVRFSLRRGDALTALDGSARTVGPADLFAGTVVRQSSRYMTEGRTLFVSLWDRGDGPRQRIVAWEGGAPVRIETPPPEEELTPIPAGEMEATVDPAFPWLDTLARLDGGADCGGTYRVFDGVRRMDIILAPIGPHPLEDDRGWTYAGPAVACALRFRRVGGFPTDRDVAEADYERTIWFARIDGAHVPVRLRVEWPLGYATARIDLR